jgi:hypothetical protein
MAIVRVGGGGLERRVGLKAAKKAAKKGAKHAIEKHAAKKHAEKHPGKKAAKKTAPPHEKHASESREHAADASHELIRAFHHLQRASALISLLEQDSGGDLRHLLEYGIELYRMASRVETSGGKDVVRCAVGLLKASEHLAMAGLYAARVEHRVLIEAPPSHQVERHIEKLGPRLDELDEPQREQARRLLAMARELVRRAEASRTSDPHLAYELTMAADGLCTALEEGL